jgi:hypothetical protein
METEVLEGTNSISFYCAVGFQEYERKKSNNPRLQFMQFGVVLEKEICRTSSHLLVILPLAEFVMPV